MTIPELGFEVDSRPPFLEKLSNNTDWLRAKIYPSDLAARSSALGRTLSPGSYRTRRATRGQRRRRRSDGREKAVLNLSTYIVSRVDVERKSIRNRILIRNARGT